jgi:hypothetical protein
MTIPSDARVAHDIAYSGEGGSPLNPYAAFPGSGLAVDDIARVPKAPRVVTPGARGLVVGLGPAGVLMILIGAIFSAIGSTMVYALCATLPGDLALAVASQTTDGTITSVSTVSNVSVNHVHPRAFAFDYRVDGAEYHATSSSMNAPGLRLGASASVEYLSFAPDVARLTGTMRTAGGWALLFPILFPTVGFLVFIAPIRRYLRARRAFVHGTPVLGAVVSFGPDRSTRVNGRNPTQLLWTFTVGGASYRGSISTMTPMLLGERVPGAPVVILHDPANPAVNTLWVE